MSYNSQTHYHKVEALQLWNKRNQFHYSQIYMAKFFDLNSIGGRDSVRKWELGISKCKRDRRVYWILWLRDKLCYTYVDVKPIWAAFTEDWDWKPLSETEWNNASPNDLAKLSNSENHIEQLFNPEETSDKGLEISEALPDLAPLSIEPVEREDSKITSVFDMSLQKSLASSNLDVQNSETTALVAPIKSRTILKPLLNGSLPNFKNNIPPWLFIISGIVGLFFVTGLIILLTGLFSTSALKNTTQSISIPAPFTVNGMAYVAEGSYNQGSNLEQIQFYGSLCAKLPHPDCQWDFFTDELSGDPSPTIKPRQVYLSAFYIDINEITNQQFQNFVRATNYVTTAELAGESSVFNNSLQQYDKLKGANWRFPGGPASSIQGKDNYPVVHISYPDAVQYCSWMNKRLPKEAEWEKAARGPNSNLFPWGNDWHPDYGNYVKLNADGSTTVNGMQEVGKYPQGASFYNVNDLMGNATEWVADVYDPDFYRKAELRNPLNIPDSKTNSVSTIQHTKRGGSWATRPGYLHSSWRIDRPDTTNDTLGFRCARNP